MIKAGIVGGTGYTGVELLRILLAHPQVEVAAVTSRANAGEKVADLYPSLRGLCQLDFCQPSISSLADCQVVFFATPNGTAMTMAKQLLELGIKVIDLSADFRIKDQALWEKWYQMPHACPDLIADAVYGLPEINRQSLASANLVACPGCYPTAVQLGFLPLLENNLIDPKQLIADGKSGVSGAGRAAQTSALMSEVGESFAAYAVSGHRHLPEIIQGLQLHTAGEVGLTFTPHLSPMIRGIFATLYGVLRGDTTADEVQQLFASRYKNEPFVDVLQTPQHPNTRNVRGSNNCQIAIHKPQNGKTVVVLVALDNLVKGAAGQAVQNMNLLFDLDEAQGLGALALYP